VIAPCKDHHTKVVGHSCARIRHLRFLVEAKVGLAGGTESVGWKVMRMHRRTMRTVATVTAVAVILLAACDTTTVPTTAAVGSAHAAINGRQALVVSPGALTLAVASTFQLNTNAPTTLRNLLQWSSGGSNVASVSPSGGVFGAGTGSATVSVRYSDDTTNVGTATITVTGAANTADRAPAGR
jgi:hypothetical protein